jgi:hypothetical protein
MSDLIKLVPKQAVPEETEEETIQANMDSFYEQLEELRPALRSILTIAYTHDDELIALSNGVDSKLALWMAEDFKLNCIAGTFSDYDN